MVNLKFAKTKTFARIPSKRDEDAGYDIYACFDEDEVVIPSLGTKLIPTGIASVIPEGYYMQIEERGSTGSKGIKKSAGVIDSGYRNEWFIAITNCNDKPLVISKKASSVACLDKMIIYPYGKAIAQAVLHEVPVSKVEEITFEELQKYESERMNGNIGSSNK